MARIIDWQAAPADFSISASVSYSGAKNLAAAVTIVPTLLCPADRAAGSKSNPMYASTNYAGNAGDGALAGSLTKANGVFYLGSSVRLRDVTDGTSKTMALSERTWAPLAAIRKNYNEPRFASIPGRLIPPPRSAAT